MKITSENFIFKNISELPVEQVISICNNCSNGYPFKLFHRNITMIYNTLNRGIIMRYVKTNNIEQYELYGKRYVKTNNIEQYELYGNWELPICRTVKDRIIRMFDKAGSTIPFFTDTRLMYDVDVAFDSNNKIIKNRYRYYFVKR